jgi:ligand-binding sensor domain-containing protein
LIVFSHRFIDGQSYEDKSQRFWVGTNNGLNQFDRYTEKFVRYLPALKDPNSLITGKVSTIHEDRSGTLWIGTSAGGPGRGGLHKLVLIPSGQNEASNHPTPTSVAAKFIRYLHNSNNPHDRSDGSVICILEDQAGALWLGTWASGLKKFDPQTETFTHYMHDPKNPNSLSNNSVWSGFQDRSGSLWFSTYGGGLNKFDPQSGRFTCYKRSSEDSSSYNFNRIDRFYADRSGAFWLKTAAGSYQFDRQAEKFLPVRFGSNGQHPLSSALESIHEDQFGILWIGTINSGLIRWDRKPKKFSQYLHDPDNPISVKSDLRTLYEDKSGRLWILTHRSGVIRFDPATETFTHFKHDPRNPRSLSSNVVSLIGEDSFGAIWIGTFDAGLNRFDRDTETFIRYQHDPLQPHSLSDNHVRWIYEDRFGTLWIGTWKGGLNRLVLATDEPSPSRQARRFDAEAVKFIHFKPYDDDPRNDLGPLQYGLDNPRRSIRQLLGFPARGIESF